MPNADNKLVYSVREYGPKTGKVVFLFCPFGVASWQMALPGMPIWHLIRNGYRVIAYSYGLSIITKTPALTRRNLVSILADADKRLRSINSDEPVYCFGTSMGTVLAINFASRNVRVSKLVLNLSYNNIADHIMRVPFMWLITPKKLNHYIASGGGEKGLHELFDPFSPNHLLSRLKGRSVLLYTSRSDRILKHEDTKNLKQDMMRAGINVQYIENKRGSHYLAALANHLRARTYLRFLARR